MVSIFLYIVIIKIYNYFYNIFVYFVLILYNLISITKEHQQGGIIMVFLGHLLTAIVEVIVIAAVAVGGVYLGKFLSTKKRGKAN